MSKTFIIVTANMFPSGDAGAVRLTAFSNILISLGYSPFVICMGRSTFFDIKQSNGVSYISLRYDGTSLFSRIKGRLLYLNNLKKVLFGIDKKNVFGVLIDFGSISTFRFLEKYTKNSDIRLFYDCVEWFSPSEFKFGIFNPFYYTNNFLNTRVIDKKYSVISISRYLENYFSKKKLNTLRVPPIMDVENITHKKNNYSNNKIRVLYAGSIGRKDHISVMIDSLRFMSQDELQKLEFRVIGITKEQYEKKYDSLDNPLPVDCVTFKGKASREEVLEELNCADFSFLLRPSEKRYAKAGFPTKIVEALSSGTPVLCNLSSDLSLFLNDGENSIVIDECSIESCIKALKRIVALSREDIVYMSKSARKTAVENFDWRLYVDDFRGLIDVRVKL